MKSWGLKEINFRTATMIINSTDLRETTHSPIFNQLHNGATRNNRSGV